MAKSILMIVKTGPAFRLTQPTSPISARMELELEIGEKVFFPKYGNFATIEGIYFDGCDVRYRIDGEEYEVNELLPLTSLEICRCCGSRAVYLDSCYECGFDPDEIEPTLSVTERHGVSGFLRPKI